LICGQEQRFNKLLRWLLILDLPVVTAIIVFAFYKTKMLNLPIVVFILIAAVFIQAIPMIMIWAAKLQTIVCRDGLYVRFFPFHIKFKRFAFEDIGEYYARQYSPLKEYGGWGIRFTFRNGKAYNISGNKGLQIVFKNGKKLLIGSQNPQELVAAIDSIIKNSHKKSG